MTTPTSTLAAWQSALAAEYAAVFYYGAAFAVVGSIGLLLLVPGTQDRHNRQAAK